MDNFSAKLIVSEIEFQTNLKIGIQDLLDCYNFGVEVDFVRRVPAYAKGVALRTSKGNESTKNSVKTKAFFSTVNLVEYLDKSPNWINFLNFCKQAAEKIPELYDSNKFYFYVDIATGATDKRRALQFTSADLIKTDQGYKFENTLPGAWIMELSVKDNYISDDLFEDLMTYLKEPFEEGDSDKIAELILNENRLTINKLVLKYLLFTEEGFNDMLLESTQDLV